MLSSREACWRRQRAHARARLARRSVPADQAYGRRVAARFPSPQQDADRLSRRLRGTAPHSFSKRRTSLTGERVLVRWTPQDLRRSVATHIAEDLGVGGEQLVRRVLGHSDGTVTAIYNRHGYVWEMRAALESWARKLLPRRGQQRLNSSQVWDGSHGMPTNQRCRPASDVRRSKPVQHPHTMPSRVHQSRAA